MDFMKTKLKDAFIDWSLEFHKILLFHFDYFNVLLFYYIIYFTLSQSNN